MNGGRPIVALSVLVSGLNAEMARLGREDSDGLVPGLPPPAAVLPPRGAEEFSLDVAMAWVDEAGGFFAREQAGIVTSGLPEWNKDPGLLGWLTSL